MTLNLPLLYVLWLEEYCQINPNKNRSPNLWHVTSILVCCIFANVHVTSVREIKSGDILFVLERNFVSQFAGKPVQLHQYFNLVYEQNQISLWGIETNFAIYIRAKIFFSEIETFTFKFFSCFPLLSLGYGFLKAWK